MTDTARHLALGLRGEEAVCRSLVGRGWRILARNWRPAGASHGLELDIVARQRDCLVFVEVKTRRVVMGGQSGENGRKGQAGKIGRERGEGSAFSPLRVPIHAAMGVAKQKKLLKAAGHYLTAHALWDAPCRFDLFCVGALSDGSLTLEHHRNVIEFGQALDRGDAAWQPW